MTRQNAHRQIAEVILHNMRFGGLSAVERAENKNTNTGVVVKFCPELTDAEIVGIARELSILAAEMLEEWGE